MTGGSVEGSVRLRQAPEAVWAFIVALENFPKYVAGYETGEAISAQTSGVGFRFRWRGKTWGIPFESEEEVIEWDPGRRIRFEGRLAPFDFRSSMLLAPEGEGTRLTVRIRYRWRLPVIGWAVGAVVVGPILRRSVRQSLKKLERWDRGAEGRVSR